MFIGSNYHLVNECIAEAYDNYLRAKEVLDNVNLADYMERAFEMQSRFYEFCDLHNISESELKEYWKEYLNLNGREYVDLISERTLKKEDIFGEDYREKI